ncbi:MAG TPA: hypothetical protein VKK61_11940 [Tepidisphaeraceae bacterium]|jgi:hypothetical protein|nr:hypothetical protein [Tepidisphaeraceae bacterium]
MKHTWLVALGIGLLPAVTFADHRGFDRGRDFGRGDFRHFDRFDHFRDHSRSFFGFSFDFGAPVYSYRSYSPYYYSYYAPPPVVYDDAPVCDVPPPVVYRYSPPTYYYAAPPVNYDIGVRYYYRR